MKKEFDIYEFALKIAAVDNWLGNFADYEGTLDSEGGGSPTIRLYEMGQERFLRRCDEAIDAHSQAISLWRAAKKKVEKESEKK